MGNRLWEKDGLARGAFEDRGTYGRRVEVLESDAWALLAGVLEKARQVVFVNEKNAEDGCWQEVWRWEPLVVLTEIRMLDTSQLEQDYLAGEETGAGGGVEELAARLADWENRLRWNEAPQLLADLQRLNRGGRQGKEKFYRLLEGLRNIQLYAGRYLEEIEGGGRMDPALALLLVFLRNYSRLAGDFNRRWEQLETFYLEEVLHSRPGDAVPDRVWLSLCGGRNTEEVVVRKGTRFGVQSGGEKWSYSSLEDCRVGSLVPARIRSLYVESEPGWQPAADLGFVTGLWTRGLELQGDIPAMPLFGGKEAGAGKAGILVGSPMLLLGEGTRRVEIRFTVAAASAAELARIAGVCGGNRFLEDAFYAEITTAGGWERINGYVADIAEGDTLRLTFRLDEEFPPVVCNSSVAEGCTVPVLRLLLNREAWLFPYSWARQMVFTRMKIRTAVRGCRQVKVYTELGEMEVQTSFYPFGVQPEKGAWMMFGNYEMALKPVMSVGLSCRWMGLPEQDGGLEEYYREYGEGVRNESFRVRMEWLSDGKWQGSEGPEMALFRTGKRGRLEEYGSLRCRPGGKMGVVGGTGLEYVPGQARNGFLRLVFTSPAMGFGHQLYRRLFAQVMMYNSLRKKAVAMPPEPVTLQMDALTLDYEAEDEVVFAAGGTPGAARLYHILPWEEDRPVAVATDRPVPFVEGTDCPYSLLLEFRNAVGYNSLRFFVDFVPLLQESVSNECPAADDMPGMIRHGRWSLFCDGRWLGLPPVNVLRDDTGGFVRSGLIELNLPRVVKAADLNARGCLVVKVEFRERQNTFPALRGIFTNVVEAAGVDGGDISGIAWGNRWKPEQNLPGIAGVVQASAGCGGKKREDREAMALRLADRIAARGRPVNAGDYERAVLLNFPQVMKVKCLPSVDTKGWGRRGVVTLVMMQKQADGSLPLCSNSLLIETEELLGRLAGSFVIVDAINPVYEEMTVRCNITLMAGFVAGVVIKGLETRLNEYIAPWLGRGDMPVFGHFFSLQALRNMILEDPGVAAVAGLSVLHVTSDGVREYGLNEYTAAAGDEQVVKASQPWSVAVPARRHLIDINGSWQERVGIGELEVGRTLVVGEDGKAGQ